MRFVDSYALNTNVFSLFRCVFQCCMLYLVWMHRITNECTRIGRLTAAASNDHKTAHKQLSAILGIWQHKKAFSFRGGTWPPNPPIRGSVPGPLWGHCPQAHNVIGSRFTPAIAPSISTPGSAPGWWWWWW